MVQLHLLEVLFRFKFLTKYLNYNITTRFATTITTTQILYIVQEIKVNERNFLLNNIRIPVSLLIDDDERCLHRDFERRLECLAPHEPYK